MARYYDVRGFISCGFDEIDRIKSIVDREGHKSEYWTARPERLDLYQSGWLYQTRILNSTAHAFYGGSVQWEGVELVLACLKAVALTLPEVEGSFFVDDDEGQFSETWALRDGSVIVSEGCDSE